MSFKDLISHNLILQAIEEAGHTIPTPIQEKVIPKIIEGSDLQASSETGSGKTAAFVLPALHRLLDRAPGHGKGPRVLILVPTRELAMQVAQETKKYGKNLPKIKAVCIYGGVPYPKQLQDLSRPYEILIATPGRLIDHLDRRRISLARTELFILDEADRMLDMGFIEPVEQIAALLPKQHQTLLFSATLKGSVLKLSQKLLHNPIQISVERDLSLTAPIEQRLHPVDNLEHKYRLLEHLLQDNSLKQAIIFTATKQQADLLADKLSDKGHEVEALHGDLNQRQRTRTMMKLRKEEIRILVATDVAARGIDVLTISHIINFDLPRCPEDYVHRIGRTGRAGNTGIALSFVAPKDRSLVKRIEQFTGSKMIHQTIPGLEPKSKMEGHGHARTKRSDSPFQKRKTFGKKFKRPFFKKKWGNS